MRLLENPLDLTEEDAVRFAVVLKKQKRLAIPIAQVDPDGIGSAMGLVAIAGHFGVACDVTYAGAFGHPQTRMVWELFGLEARIRKFA